eukprot:6460846-Amphidinium_carterae.3
MKSMKGIAELCEAGDDATAELMGRGKKAMTLMHATVFDATMASLMEDKRISDTEKAKQMENAFKQITKLESKYGWQVQGAMNKFFISKASEIISKPDV